MFSSTQLPDLIGLLKLSNIYLSIQPEVQVPHVLKIHSLKNEQMM